MKTRTTFMLLSFAILMAAKSDAQTTFGLNIGSSIANVHSKDGPESDVSNSKAGLILGVLLDVPLGNSFSFQPALNFVQKGGKKDATLFATYKMTVNVNYLEIPMNFNYNAPGGFFVGAGPSFSYGLSGKYKLKGSDGTSEEEKVNFGSDSNADIKRFELGANVQAGYKIKKRMMVTANYNIGLSNLAPGNEGSFKNNYFGVKLGFSFPSSSKG